MDSPTIELTGAQAILRVLRAAGIHDAFGLASGKLSPIYRAMSEDPEWCYTGVRHEAAAAFMATAVGWATGRMAMCLGETGPGSQNLLSALGGASANGLAAIALTSSNPSFLLDPHRGAFSSSRNETAFGLVCKSSSTLRDGDRIPEVVRHALRTALSGRPGPVHLDVPAEVLAGRFNFDRAELDAEPGRYRALAPSLPVPSVLAEAADLLASARRPLVIAGGGVVRSGATAAVRALVERLGAPAITTQMGIGVIADGDPHLLGQGGLLAGPAAKRAMAEADVVLAIGCRFSSFLWMEGPPAWNARPDQKLIQIDIDPTVFGRNAPVSLGLLGDANATANALLEVVSGPDLDAEWTARLNTEAQAYRSSLLDLAEDVTDPLHPAALARAVGSMICATDLVTYDGGHTSFWSNDFTPVSEPATRFHEPGAAHLGFGLASSIAMARVMPDRRHFCLTGDGALGFTIQELDTARRYGANVITVVHNNAAWGVIAAGQRKGGFSLGTDLEGTDYAAIAKGFGCHGEVVHDVDQVAPAIERALASGLPAVIDARVRFAPHPMMPVFGKSTSR